MKNKILIGFVLSMFVFNIFIIYKIYFDNKLMYVNTLELYNSFLYKKELEKKLINKIKEREKILENIKMEIIDISNKKIENITDKDKEKYQRLNYEYKTKQQQFNKENEQLQQDYDAKIRERINKYVKEFGEKSNIKILLGANGTGNIMYADESIDITKDVLKYINDKYEDK